MVKINMLATWVKSSNQNIERKLGILMEIQIFFHLLNSNDNISAFYNTVFSLLASSFLKQVDKLYSAQLNNCIARFWYSTRKYYL